MKGNDYYVPPHKRGVRDNSNITLQNGGNHQQTFIESTSQPRGMAVSEPKAGTDKARAGNYTPHQHQDPKLARSKKSELGNTKANLKYTGHALVRAEQRDISNEVVEKALCSGEKANHEKGVSTYRDEDTLVVMGGQHVVTVMENKPNAQYDLLRQTKHVKRSVLKKHRTPTMIMRCVS